MTLFYRVACGACERESPTRCREGLEWGRRIIWLLFELKRVTRATVVHHGCLALALVGAVPLSELTGRYLPIAVTVGVDRAACDCQVIQSAGDMEVELPVVVELAPDGLIFRVGGVGIFIEAAGSDDEGLAVG